MKDNLDPEINPAAGVKRLNKKPLALIIGAGALVALVMIYGISTKGRKDSGEPLPPETVVNNDDSISALTQKIPNHIPGPDIPPDLQAKPEVDAAGAPVKPERTPEEAKAYAEKIRAVADAPMSVDLKAFQRVYAQMDEEEIIRQQQAEKAIEKRREQELEAASVLPPRNEFAEVLPPLGEAQRAFNARREDGEVILPYKVQQPASDLELKAGSVINATMITGINSDLPGNIIAQVNANVFDTRTGDYLLIPQGTRVFGTYDDQNKMGVDRVAVAWSRLIFPDGSSVTLENMSGSDVEGYSGLKDRVDNHYMRIFGSALMLSSVGTGVALAGDSGTNETGQNLTAQQAATNEVAINLGRVITEKLRQDINIEPTIMIRPGMKLAIIVSKDLTFSTEYRQHLDYSKLGHPSEPVRIFFDPTKGQRNYSSKQTTVTYDK